MTGSKVPEMQEWEGSKENIQPLRQGRKASALSHVYGELSSNPLERQAALQKEQQVYEQRILQQSSEADDPLQLFIEYMQWIIECHTSSNTLLFELIERITKTFVDDGRYINDPRFIKVWLLYAQYSKDPLEVFQFMEAKKVGLSLASYYEDFSAYLEFACKKFKEADEILLLGINRKALPLEKLKKYYNEFQLRMMQSKSKDSSVSKSMANFMDPIGISKPKESKGSIQIFSDDSSNLSIPEAGKKWKLVAESSRNKENYFMPSSWIGIVKPIKSSLKAPKIPIYKDPIVEKRGYDSSLICSGNRELSFEEIRANCWMLANALEAQKKHNENDDLIKKLGCLLTEGEQEKITRNEGKITRSDGKLTGNEGKITGNEGKFTMNQGNFTINEENISKNEANTSRSKEGITGNEEIKSIVQQPIPSPTVNTKAALEEIMKMFSDPLASMSNNDENDTFDLSKTQFPTIADVKPASIPAPKFEIFCDEDVKQCSKSKLENPFIVEKPQEASVKSCLKKPAEACLSRVNSIHSLNDYEESDVEKEDFMEKLKTYPDYHKHNTYSECNLDELRKFIDEDDMRMVIGQDVHYVKKKMSETCIAKGYSGTFLTTRLGMIDSDDITISPSSSIVKIDQPSSPWEFYVIKEIQQRVMEPFRFIKTKSFHSYLDLGIIMFEYKDQGTLSQSISYYKGKMDPILALFYSVQVLKSMKLLHDIGITHNNIRSSSFYVRLEEIEDSEWTPCYSRDGSKGWNRKGLSSSSFHRAHCQFSSKNEIALDYKEDYLGAATVMHELLTGSSEIDLILLQAGEEWKKWMQLLMDPPLVPMTNLIEEMLKEMEDVLEKYSKFPSLKSMLKKQEILIYEHEGLEIS